MFSVFMELVKRVGIFVIIGQTILHFGISKKYEKYMKLVISFMVGAQIVLAFGVYFKQDDEQVNFMAAEEYLKTWETNMEELEERVEESKSFMLQNVEKEAQKSERVGAKGGNPEGNHIKIEKIIIQ